MTKKGSRYRVRPHLALFVKKLGHAAWRAVFQDGPSADQVLVHVKDVLIGQHAFQETGGIVLAAG